MKIKKECERWLANAVADTDVAAELKAMDLCGSRGCVLFVIWHLESGGLRGVIGAGTNRMNIYTVAKASQGLADYLKKHFKEPSVAIGYDSRIKSDVFAKVAAGVFAANGVSVNIWPVLMAGTDRIFCDSLSAYFSRCHGDSFPQSRQIQWLQGLWC